MIKNIQELFIPEQSIGSVFYFKIKFHVPVLQDVPRLKFLKMTYGFLRLLRSFS